VTDLGVAALAAIIGGMAVGTVVKGVTGSGLPMVAIPVMATFLGVEDAVVIMAIPSVLTNGWMVWSNRTAAWRATPLPVLVVTGCVGSVLGVALLAWLDERWLAGILAGVLVTYLVVRLRRPAPAISDKTDRWLRPVAGSGAGLLQGATGLSSPVIIMYLHSLRLGREVYLVTLTSLICLTTAVQAISLGAAGLYTEARLWSSLVAMVPIALVLPVAMRLGRRLSPRRFDIVIRWLLAAAAVKLVFDAITG